MAFLPAPFVLLLFVGLDLEWKIEKCLIEWQRLSVIEIHLLLRSAGGSKS
jgi:hypothetical protein